jgi:chromosomal replication initiation ATPase DnaA
MKRILEAQITGAPQEKLREIETLLRQAGASYCYREVDEAAVLLQAIKTVLHVSLDEMQSTQRSKKIAYARRIFFYHMHRIFPDYSMGRIGGMVGKTTSAVSHGIERFNDDNKGKNNPEFRDAVTAIEAFCRHCGACK